MRKTLLLVSAFWLTLSGSAQRTLDVGLWGGTSNYFGDLEDVSHFQSIHPTIGAFLRYNFNPRVGLRFSGLFGDVGADGILFGENASFDKAIQDFTLQCEINYLRYIFGEKKTPFSSYILGGLGVMHYPDQFTATIPFGFGVKFNLGKRMALGVEYQMRKLFDDSLDDIVDPLEYTVNSDEVKKYTDMWHNNDWVTFLGVHITYFMSLSKKPCPAYERID